MEGSQAGPAANNSSDFVSADIGAVRKSAGCTDSVCAGSQALQVRNRDVAPPCNANMTGAECSKAHRMKA